MRAERPAPEGLMTLLGAAWLGLFPLWQDGSYSRITRAKWLGMLVMFGVTAAAVLVMIVLRRGRRQGRKPRLAPAQGLALAYLAWLGVSAIFGSFAGAVNGSGQLAVLMGSRRYEGLAAQGCYVGLFLLMSLYPPRLRSVMNAAALGMLIYAGIVALQYAGYNPLGLFPAGLSVRTNYEFQGTIGNIDMVSGYLCLIAPALLSAFVLGAAGPLCLLGGCAGTLMLLLMRVQSGVIALAAVLAALVVLALLRPEVRGRACLALGGALAAFSLGRLVGLPWLDGTETLLFPYAPTVKKTAPLILGGLLALLSPGLTRRPGPKVPVKWLLVLIALGMVAALAVVLTHDFPEGSALWEIREALGGRGQDSFGSERLGIWRMTLEMARDNLLFGTGPDTFWYAMGDYQLRTGQSLAQRFDSPHNMLLAVLSGSGVPALALYVALMAAVAAGCLRASRRDPWPLALLAGLAAYLLQGMFTFSICLVTPMFWAMLGMAVSLNQPMG